MFSDVPAICARSAQRASLRPAVCALRRLPSPEIQIVSPTRSDCRRALPSDMHPETKAGPTKDHVDNLSTWNAKDNLATAFSSATADALDKDERTVRRARRVPWRRSCRHGNVARQERGAGRADGATQGRVQRTHGSRKGRRERKRHARKRRSRPSRSATRFSLLGPTGVFLLFLFL